MKRLIISKQAIFAGTRYDKQAAKILVDSGIFDQATADSIIDALFHEDIHAFVHAPNWLEKYLKGIARMSIEEGHGSAQGVANFLETCVDTFDQFLTYVKENRNKLGGSAFDTKFNTQMHYQDVVDFLDDIYSERETQSKKELQDMEFSSSNFELVPIESYEQMHDLFGGHWTGDGSSDAYAGGGGTAWCHTNDRSTYDSWVRKGKFYVLMNKNFKKIPFNPNTPPKDDYDNSLIAILVDKKNGKLLNATLRCNHVGINSVADNQYKTYAELSKVAGFNVEDEVLADLGDSVEKVNWVDYNQESFNIGDKINVYIGGKGEFSATAVKQTSDGMLFVFDSTVGENPMTSMNAYLDSLLNLFPQDLQNRVTYIRLLTASEVFSNCDQPDEWNWLQKYGAYVQESQIPYFRDADHRISEDERPWWLDTELRSAHSSADFALVVSGGYTDYDAADYFYGVRPAFAIQ